MDATQGRRHEAAAGEPGNEIMDTTMDRRALLATLGAAFSAALAVPGSALARALTEGDLPAIKAFIDSYVDTKKLPGMVCGVKYKDSPARYVSAGTLAFDTELKAGPDSIYRVYSMTKPITGMAAMKLIEENKLGLDQPLGDIVPEMKNMKVFTDMKTGETAPAKKPILIRHLMTHTAGLSYSIMRGPLATLYTKKGITPGGREKVMQPGADLPPAKTLDELVQRVGETPLNREPGTGWEYSIGLDVLGCVIQRVSKMSFSDYLHKSFFVPLKMNDTDFMVPKAKAERLSSVYALKAGKPEVSEDRKTSPYLLDRDIQSGGGGLASTAHDYLRFDTMKLNGGTLDGHRVVKPETIKLASSDLLPPECPRAGIAFGMGDGFGAGVAVVSDKFAKPGGQPGGSHGWFGIAGTQEWTDPVNNLAVVLMLQLNPTAYPVRGEIRTAAYKDFAAMKA